MSKFVVSSKKMADNGGYTPGNAVFAAGRSWRPLCVDVSFNANGGTASQVSATYQIGRAYGSLPTATKSGKGFAGWYKDQALTQRVQDGSFADWYAPTLYAKWLDPTAVTWDATTNGGQLVGAPPPCYVGLPFGTLPQASKTDYEFAGWWTAADGGTQISPGETFTGQVTCFYAQFAEPASFAATLSPDGSFANFSTCDDYPWTLTSDDGLGITGAMACRDLTANEGQFSVLSAVAQRSGYVEFDLYCDTESHYDGMYVIKSSSTPPFYFVNDLDTESGTGNQPWRYYSYDQGQDTMYGWQYSSDNGDYVYVCSGYPDNIGHIYDSSQNMYVDPGDVVWFVYGNDANDGEGYNGQKSQAWLLNVRIN